MEASWQGPDAPIGCKVRDVVLSVDLFARARGPRYPWTVSDQSTRYGAV